MECKARLIWDDGIWYSEVLTDKGEDVRLTLESNSFDVLAERVRVALPEMLELNFGYAGDILLSFEADRQDSIKAAAS